MNTPPVTVYYNSACPVCEAGICYQRQRMQGQAVDFVDVHTRPEIAQELGIDLELLRERLHVRDAGGQLHVGADAVTTLMAHTRGQRLLASLARPLRFVTVPLYKLAARMLYRWNRRRGSW
jgi:predicted DCC family thiol-disulfide oxidoreductase YuxK